MRQALRNVIERMVITSANDLIQVEELPSELKNVNRPSTPIPSSLAEAMEKCERNTIQSALEACHHRENTARSRQGISVRTLHHKMSRYGLH
ncbi:MAG: hypothetical protein U0905_10035 [Pirellulales bacterium]